jgi:CBS domain containing-hemolysin-like protein
MIILALMLFLVGLAHSFLFSGSETGFYRAHRLKFVLDGIKGDKSSQWMVSLFNHPTWFVSTILVGNNIANYLISLSIVLMGSFFGPWAEFSLPIAFTPLLFVYGELLPKNIFYMSPNYLLRLVSPLVVLFALLFSPVSLALWGLSKLIEKLIGQSPVKIKTTLARKELQQLLDEGQEAGILHSTQRQLAEGFLLLAAKPVREFSKPLSEIQFVQVESSVDQALKIAQRFSLTEIPLVQHKSHQLQGYVKTADLLLEKFRSKPIRRIRKIPAIKSTEPYGEALIQMQSGDDTMMKVVSPQGQTLGLVTLNQLTNALLEGNLDSLKR